MVTLPDGAADESESAWLSRLNKPITDFDALGFVMPPFFYLFFIKFLKNFIGQSEIDKLWCQYRVIKIKAQAKARKKVGIT